MNIYTRLIKTVGPLFLFVAGSILVHAEGETPWRLDSALGSPEWLTVSGTHRIRYETLDHQFKAGKSGGDQILNYRTFLMFKADLPEFDIVVEFEDSRQSLADEGTSLSTSIVNPLELLQANISWSAKDWLIAGSNSNFTLGRMTMDVGSRRFVARNGYRNTRNAFTGVDWTLKIDQERTFRAFYTLPVMRYPTDTQSLMDNKNKWDKEYSDVSLWGLYYEQKNLPLSGIAEFYLYGLKEDDNADFATKNRELYTPGFRFYRKPKTGTIDFEIETTLQWGETRSSTKASDTTDLDVFAGFIHVSAGYSFDAAWKPRLLIQYDFASGDDNPRDGDFNRFDTLYGIGRSELCATGIYGPVARSNISTPGCHLYLKPSANTKLMLAWRYYWLESATDTWTSAKITDTSGASGRALGSQTEMQFTWDAIPGNLKIELGGAYFDFGRFAKTAPGSTGVSDTLHAYAQATFQF